MATGVQTWSGTPVTNATADSNVNWAEGMAPSQVNDSARALMASVAKWRDDNNSTLITSGSSTALTLVTNQVEATATAGYTVAVTFGTAVDVNATLAVDGLAAAPIQITRGTNISAGQLSSGMTCQFTYSSTGTGQWVITDSNPVIVPAAPNSPAGGQIAGTPPPSWTATTIKMMGMGSSFVFVPKVTGRCNLAVTLGGSANAVEAIRAQIYFGSGGAASAPTSGAATAGTSVGLQVGNLTAGAGLIFSIMPTAQVSGLTIGTSYWVDLGFTLQAGTWTSSSAQFTYQEF